MGLYLGLISGTSMDALDAALVDFDCSPLRVVAATATAFDPRLKQRIAKVLDTGGFAPLDEIGQLDVEVGAAFAAATLDLLARNQVPAERVTAIGSHGQTLRHKPDAAMPFTWQIGDPNVLAERTGIQVVADFRRRDVAAGGQGAPLVPSFHDHVFRSDTEDRVIANIGGISNITMLRRGSQTSGFDTGPGNRLLDAWSLRHQGREFDSGGAWAAQGKIDQDLLGQLMAQPYLSLPPPKSTGRELFNPAWLDAILAQVPRRTVDVQATLLEYTAATLAAAIRDYAPNSCVYVCGGGAHNLQLLARLGEILKPYPVASTARLGLDPDYVEAVAFAWFAKRTLEGQTSTLPSVTGATGPRILGGIYAGR